MDEDRSPGVIIGGAVALALVVVLLFCAVGAIYLLRVAL